MANNLVKLQAFQASDTEITLPLAIRGVITASRLKDPRNGTFGLQYSCIITSKDLSISHLLREVQETENSFWYNNNATFKDGNAVKPTPVCDSDGVEITTELMDGSEVLLEFVVNKYEAGKSKNTGADYEAGINARLTSIIVTTVPQTPFERLMALSNITEFPEDEIPF